jgi:Ca2+-dependent lipid-binding protein
VAKYSPVILVRDFQRNPLLKFHLMFSFFADIVVECGGSSHKTDVVDSTSNPHWNNAEFEFSICKTDPGNMKVQIRVFDHDLLGADSKLGRTEIDLSSIIQRHEEELLDIWVPLTDADSGRVHVQLTYYPEYN